MSRTPAGALVAVICLELIDTCGVTFGENSFRGDAYTPQLIEAIRAAGYDDI